MGAIHPPSICINDELGVEIPRQRAVYLNHSFVADFHAKLSTTIAHHVAIKTYVPGTCWGRERGSVPRDKASVLEFCVRVVAELSASILFGALLASTGRLFLWKGV